MAFIINNIDVDAKQKGVWKEFKDGGEFKITHMSSEDFIKAREEANEMEDEEAKNKHLAKAMIKDWRGVVDTEGNELKFDPDIVAQELKDNSEFYTFVLTTATQEEDYKRVKEAKKAEKVKKPSSGN